MRKTNKFDVQVLKERINARLADDKVSQEVKEELCHTLEQILFDTNNYCGYNYLKWVQGGCREYEEAIKAGFIDKHDEEARNACLGLKYNRMYY